MKAIVFTQYGPPDVLQLTDVAKPTPGDDEVLIRVLATSVNFGDLLARRFNKITPSKFSMPMLFWFPTRIMLGLRKPRKKILGSEFAGKVEAVGKTVKNFKVGDQVFGYRGIRFGGPQFSGSA